MRTPTVPGTPPQLVGRYADDEVWLVRLPERDEEEESEDSELEGASTSSGEYTIRERSSDSSGNYQPNITSSPDTVGHDQPPSREEFRTRARGVSSTRVRGALALGVALQGLDSAEGRGEDLDHCVAVDYTSGERGNSWLYHVLIGLLMGWLLGVGCVQIWRSCRSLKQPQADIQVNVSTHVNASPSGERSVEGASNRAVGQTDPPPLLDQEIRLPRAPRSRRGGRQRLYMYVTARGECIHLSPNCSTLRGAEIQERAICQKCQCYELHVH